MAAVNIIFSVGFFIFMYKFLPLLAATGTEAGESRVRRADHLQPGGWHDPHRAVPAVHLGGFVWSDIHRVYEYHGAEHKTVYAFENGDPLDTAAVQKYSTYHPRCGTSFLMTVMIISIAGVHARSR